MNFKGVRINVGDYIALQTTLSATAIHAAVIRISEDALDVLSPVFAPHRYDGRLQAEEVSQIEVCLLAVRAIPQESGDKYFYRRQRVSTSFDGKRHTGCVIAALGGIVAVRKRGGEVMIWEASRFDSISKPIISGSRTQKGKS